MRDDPLGHVINLILEFDTPTTCYIRDLLDNDVDDALEASEKLKRVVNSDSNKLTLYKRSIQNLTFMIFTVKKNNVNELERMDWTRLRLSSHCLAIDVGRWNRRGRGRLPIEERMCVCVAKYKLSNM